MKFKSLILHPFLFAIYPILFLFSHNIEQVRFQATLMPLVIVLCFVSTLFLLDKFITKSSLKTGIIISIFLVLFFFFGHIFELINGWKIGSFEFGRYRYLLPAGILFFIGSSFLIIKTRKKLHDFSTLLNLVSATLVMIVLINIGFYELVNKNQKQSKNTIVESEKDSLPLLNEPNPYRDIYYIILDEHASSRTLKNIYNYSNQTFIDDLSKKGFYIASNSQSNYPMTFLSLTSSLNMKYLNFLTEKAGINSKDRSIPYRLVKNSKTMNLLKSKGYKFIHFNSGWGPTEHNEYADINVPCGRKGSAFTKMLIETTMLCPFKKALTYDDRKAVLLAFSELAELHKVEGPKFIFAHIISPHYPYVFGANGEEVPKTKLRPWEQKENYLNQLIFINKKVLELVDNILSHSKETPIIIIQSDHGTSSLFGEPNNNNWKNPNEEMLKERHGILNAYYLPQEEINFYMTQ